MPTISAASGPLSLVPGPIGIPGVALALLSAVIVYKTILYPKFLSPLRHIPGPPPRWMVGHIKELITLEPGKPQMLWHKQYGPVVRFQGIFGSERVSFLGPEAQNKILTAEWTDYERPRFLKNMLGTVAGYGLLTVTGDTHRRMRKAMNPAFSLSNLSRHVNTFYEISDGLAAIVNNLIEASPNPDMEGATIHIYPWISKATLDMITMASFGYKADSLHTTDNELASAYEILMNLQTGRNLIIAMLFFNIPGFSAYVNSRLGYYTKWMMGSPIGPLIDAMYRIRQISKTMLHEKIHEAMSFGLSNVESKRDIMSILIREREAEKSKVNGEVGMNDQAMMDQVLTFLSAGHDTTASSITWLLWLLSKDQRSQCRLREEISPIFGADSQPEYRNVKDLKFLDAVVMEGLRLMPAAPVTARTAGKTDIIDGYEIPAGTQCLIPIMAVNCNKNVWGPDAEEFNPLRWYNLPEAVKSNNLSLLSFITGPHACIGKTMSIIETKIVIGKLIFNFTFEPAYEGQRAHPDGAITMKPQDNMPLRVKKARQSED